MASLRFISEQNEGERVALDKTRMVFGRHTSCDFRLPGKTISREHFSIERNNGKYFLVDLGSVNGTRANGERVSWLELKNGDTIQAGPFALVFEEDDAEAGVTGDSGGAETPVGLDQVGRERPFTADHARLYVRQYLEGIEHFNARRYFDAHEVWEEIWLHASGETKLFYQMLIQAAVGLHHHERGNMRGASGMYQNVIDKLMRLPAVYMSIDLVDFARQFKGFFEKLIQDQSETPAPGDQPPPVISLLEVEAGSTENRTQWE
ncbi:MAG TPA: DUF309 domain-containing protein [Blastocatellia bacterium]|nr:DUF309 domain-containing protein [Blastocatellia bacterium]